MLLVGERGADSNAARGVRFKGAERRGFGGGERGVIRRSGVAVAAAREASI